MSHLNNLTNIQWKKEGIRKALTILEEIGALDRYPWFKRSYYYQIKGSKSVLLTDNPFLPKNIQITLKEIE
ncbi:MAG: hypothetical protein ACFFAJ_11935 [Candidatus Hodarchaeota archaeon]